jgi:hypothetical protein
MFARVLISVDGAYVPAPISSREPASITVAVDLEISNGQGYRLRQAQEPRHSLRHRPHGSCRGANVTVCLLAA